MGQVAERDLPTPVLRPACELHEATSVGRGDAIHLGKRVELPVRHRDGDLRELHREQAAEAAALLVRLPPHDLRSGTGEECDRLSASAELAERVAAVVVGDAAPAEPPPELTNSEDVHDELGELEGPRGKRLGTATVLIPEKPRVARAQHPGTAPGGDDDVLGVGEHVEGPDSHPPGFAHVPAVLRRLPATGLGFREVEVDPQLPKEPNRVGAGFGEELVTQAGDKEGDTHGAKVSSGGGRGQRTPEPALHDLLPDRPVRILGTETSPEPLAPSITMRPFVTAVFLFLVSALPLQAQGPVQDPRIVGLLAEVSPERLAEYLKVLTDFETRHSLSLSARSDWGVRPAREYILETMRSFSDRLEVELDCYRIAPRRRILEEVELCNVVAVLPGGTRHAYGGSSSTSVV